MVFTTLKEAWTHDGVENAVKGIVMEKNTLFDSLMGKLAEYPEIKAELNRVLLQGETMGYRPDYTPQEQLLMHGFITNRNSNIAVDNRIFEMRLYKYYTSESVFSRELREEALEYKPMFIKDGILNVPLIMERFIKTQEMLVDMTDGDQRGGKDTQPQEDGRCHPLPWQEVHHRAKDMAGGTLQCRWGETDLRLSGFLRSHHWIYAEFQL